jgi:hypothetical protein
MTHCIQVPRQMKVSRCSVSFVRYMEVCSYSHLSLVSTTEMHTWRCRAFIWSMLLGRVRIEISVWNKKDLAGVNFCACTWSNVTCVSPPVPIPLNSTVCYCPVTRFAQFGIFCWWSIKCAHVQLLRSIRLLLQKINFSVRQVGFLQSKTKFSTANHCGNDKIVGPG